MSELERFMYDEIRDVLSSTLVEVEITTDIAEAPADVYAEIVTAYVDPWSLPGCP